MERKRILVTVKTYPTLSRKYGETVCTAGVLEDGSWVRIYPVPFRRLDERQQYSKFDWIECSLHESSKDPRPETFHPSNVDEIIKVDHMGTSDLWRERRKLILERCAVYTSMEELIEGAKSNTMSLAVFKPQKMRRLLWKAVDREWNPKHLEEMRERSRQGDLFTRQEDDEWRKTFKVIPKLPYAFHYEFEDSNGKLSRLIILDWEIGALYWNCWKAAGQNEAVALEKVRMKYEDDFFQKDLHLFLGTSQQFHFRAPNPWMIVGVFPIPHDRQLSLL